MDEQGADSLLSAWGTTGPAVALFTLVLGAGVLLLRRPANHIWEEAQKKRRRRQAALPDLREEIMDCMVMNQYDEIRSIITNALKQRPELDILDFIVSRRKNGGLLCSACRLGRLECVKVFLELGADIHACDGKGETPLHLAARNGRPEVIEVLLAHQSDPNAPSLVGMTPLHVSASNGRWQITEILLQRNADVQATSCEQFRTPLHFSAQNGHERDTQLLLEHGADVTLRDWEGNTPMLAVAKNGSTKIMRHLLAYGASLSDVNEAGLTPLMRAAERGAASFVIEVIREDPVKGMEELVGLIGHIAQSEGHQLESVEERQLKLSTVFQRVIKCEDLIKPLLQAMEDRILSLGFDVLEETSAARREALQYGANQLVWLIEFVSTKEPLLSQSFVPHILDELQRLWMAMDKFVQVEAEQAQPDLQRIVDTAAPIIKMYHNIALTTAGDQSDRQIREHFQLFVDKHHNILWRVIQQNQDLLIDQLDFALYTPSRHWNREELISQLSFEQRRNWLDRQLEDLQRKHSEENITISIRRGDLLPESCSSLMLGEGSLFKGKFNVTFEGEEAVGAGVRREWFNVVAKELFDPNNALFMECADGTLQPNPASSINQDHLAHFRFAGRVIGLAIYHSELVDVHFSRSFTKQILGVTPSSTDFEVADPEYYSNLKNLLTMEDIEDLELTFTVEKYEFGGEKRVPLIPDGEHIPVTTENVAQYVDLVLELKTTKETAEQTHYFLEGLYEIVPAHLLHVFNEYQIGLLIAGIPTIDADDWKQNTVYTHFEETDSEIQWFWEIVESFSQDQRACLLQFATGTSRVPSGGFVNLRGHDGASKFTIILSEQTDALPSSSTCFNMLRLPRYPTKKIMEEKIAMATQAVTGFSLA